MRILLFLTFTLSSYIFFSQTWTGTIKKFAGDEWNEYSKSISVTKSNTSLKVVWSNKYNEVISKTATCDELTQSDDLLFVMHCLCECSDGNIFYFQNHTLSNTVNILYANSIGDAYWKAHTLIIK
jgi:hypothetical protein